MRFGQLGDKTGTNNEYFQEAVNPQNGCNVWVSRDHKSAPGSGDANHVLVNNCLLGSQLIGSTETWDCEFVECYRVEMDPNNWSHDTTRAKFLEEVQYKKYSSKTIEILKEVGYTK
jgi:hypothetical protein